jgi:ribosomal protein S6--L-glutamate ligase
MKIAILSRNTKLYSTQRLVAAARERGHTVRVLDPLRCYMRIAPGKFELNYKGRPLGKVDAVIPRIGASITRYGTAVLRQLELMGARTPNSSDAILRARDKLRCHQLLAGQGIGLPTTVFGDNPDDTDDLLGLLGKPPHVIKLIEGSQGNGVVLAERLSASRSVIEAFRGLYANFLVQEFIGEAKGADLRCFVVGERVVAAMHRQAEPGEFRSNLHRGGRASAVKLTPAEIETALRAAQVMGLQVAGVDLLRSRRGPLVLEVNSSPGLEGIEAATGVDVAGAIVEHVAGPSKPRRRAGSPARANGTRPAAPGAPASRKARPGTPSRGSGSPSGRDNPGRGRPPVNRRSDARKK